MVDGHTLRLARRRLRRDREVPGELRATWSEAPGKGGAANNGSDPWKTAGYQNISFAESYDLINWRRPAPLDTTYFSSDTRYYHDYLPCGSRWDCIYTIPVPQAGRNLSARDGYPRYGYWTASPVGCGCSGFCKQSMGFGITEDGWDWKALPSPQMVPPTVHWSEVGAVEYIPFTGKAGGAYYAMLGGNHNEKADMITYQAASPTGPFEAATKNYVLLPQVGSCYFSRFFRNEGFELLVTHQSFSHERRTFVALQGGGGRRGGHVAAQVVGTKRRAAGRRGSDPSDTGGAPCLLAVAEGRQVSRHDDPHGARPAAGPNCCQ